MEYYEWLIVLIIVVIVLLAIFALWSEIKCYAKVKRIIPAWEIEDPVQRQRQMEAVACYHAFNATIWRVALIAAVIATGLIWAVLAPYITPLMALGIGITIFIIGYFAAAFSIAHWHKPICWKATPGFLGDHEVQALGPGVHVVGDDPTNLPPKLKGELTAKSDEALSEEIEEVCLSPVIL